MDEADLPLALPDTDNFRPRGTPESPLSVIDDWMATTDPATGGPARRESSTMPQVTTRKSQRCFFVGIECPQMCRPSWCDECQNFFQCPQERVWHSGEGQQRSSVGCG